MRGAQQTRRDLIREPRKKSPRGLGLERDSKQLTRLERASRSLTRNRYYALHGLLLFMAVVAVVTAIGGGVQSFTPSVFSSAAPGTISETRAGYLTPAVVLSTSSSLLAKHQAEAEAANGAGSETPAAAPVTDDTQVQPAFFTYTVQPGDTVSSIAAQFGITDEYILWNNHVVNDPNVLLVGAKLLIPSVNGIVYQLGLGDTLAGVASYYQIDVQSVTAFMPNRLDSPDNVAEGMLLLLPGAVPPAPIPAAVEVIETPSPTAPPPVHNPTPDPPPAPPVPVENPAPPPSASGYYIWPFYAQISQYFGGYHRGIDIDGFGQYGAPIVAAQEGTVVLEAYHDWGYGYHVIIQHPDGSRTLYAHLSEIWVSQGQYVGQGEAIGALGNTGYSTGPHLHFEIHIGGIAVDPLAYLP